MGLKSLIIFALFSSPVALSQGSPDSENVYIRWGRSTCPGNDTLMYSGFGASSNHGHAGSGADMHCLTLDPKTKRIHTDSQDASLMYSVYVNTAGYGIAQFIPKHGSALICAVCVAENPTFLITGSSECPDESHELAYTGWLMGGHYTHFEKDFICVDNDLEEGGTGQVPIYPTESQNIPQYLDNVEVVCSVCRTPTKGNIYTRWGRADCPATASQLFNGTTTTKDDGHKGSGTNPLCFFDRPVYNVGSDSGNQDGSLLYIAEYEFSVFGDQWSNALENYDIPCAVCQNTEFFSGTMVYGRDDCPEGFSLDYDGVLAAHPEGSQRIKHLCIDRFAETLGTNTNNDNGKLRRVEVNVPLPHASMTQYREVTCAYCSSRNRNPIFTVWGRRECDSAHTTQIYSGAMAASFYNIHGGGSDYLCLHDDPQEIGNALNEGGPYLYQVEYETGGYGINDFKPLQDHEAPCAVCQTKNTEAISIFSGSYECPLGWEPEYSGYLMAGFHTHNGKTEFICVHESAETIENSNSVNNNGGLLYPTEVEFTADGYTTNYELMCVVCAKRNGTIVEELPPREYTTISGRIWYDANKDGTESIGEQGIPGVTIDLINMESPLTDIRTTDGETVNPDGELIGTVSTDEFGEFLFSEVEVGFEYKIEISDVNTKLAAMSATYGSSDLVWTEAIESAETRFVFFGFSAECNDNVRNWIDLGELMCDDYKKQPTYCGISDRFATESDGSAMDVCCACGGGTDLCVNESGWTDIHGIKCPLYESHVVLCDYSDLYANESGVSALSACCVCGGGVRG